jgi:hypothetical protein
MKRSKSAFQEVSRLVKTVVTQNFGGLSENIGNA